MSSPSNHSYLEKCPLNEFDSSHHLTSTIPSGQKKKITNMAVQELDNVRRFMLNYE